MTKHHSEILQNQKSFGGGLKSVLEHNRFVKPNSEFVEHLKKYLPQFFEKDIYGENGNFVKTGDFKTDKFLDELKSNNVTESRNGYKLGFVGKDYARLQTGRLSETLIVPDTKHNSQNENKNSNNIFITGDNLEALRHLQNAYRGKVKMIYIDPPYNTGKEFTYNDTFEFDDEKLKNILGYDDKDIARLKSLQGKSSHSAWLTFMYPRLRLAQKLLTDDGVIFVSIDDNEQANLKLLLDDVFGEGNFVSKFIWEKSQHFGRQKLNYYSNADYILCYAKQLSENGSLKELLIERILDEFDDAPLQNASNNVKDLTFPAGTVKFNIKDGTYNKTTSTDYILIKSVVVENGCNKNDLILRFKSRWANNTVQHEITKGTTFWVKTENFAIRTLYGPDKRGTAAPKQIIFTNSKNEFCAKNKFGMKVDTSEIATEIVNNLLQCEAFSYPKPNSLIAYFISLCANDPNDIILDFFAGSGTTAHAVMQLNAEDGGNRKFILVQIDEKTNTDSEAFKAGYQTIDEIARERIKRAAKKIKTEKGLALPENFDGGFKHFRLVAPDVKTLDKIETFDPNKPLQKDIFEDMVTVFDAKKEDGGAKGDEAILQTWFIDDGYTFDQTPQVIDFDGYKACYIDNSVLYIINPGWGAEQTKMLLNQIGTHQLNVNTIIVYGYSFTMESLRELEMNVKNILNRQVSIAIRY